VRKPRKPKVYPNRIHFLTKERHWTYAEVAERVRKLAEQRDDETKANVHEVTISRLANGHLTLSQEWMNLLGTIYDVPAQEIIAEPVAQHLTRVRVRYGMESGKWRDTNELADTEQFDVLVKTDKELEDATLYAGEVRGPSSNLRYPPKTIVVLSLIEQKPDEIQVGKRYHVRVTRSDGMIEDTVKLFTQDSEGQYWLKPESDHPNHQQWVPLKGTADLKVELIGRVRSFFSPES
jgi:hypothetical protein